MATNGPSLVLYLPDLVAGGVPRLYLKLVPFFRDAGIEVTLLLDRARGELLDAVPDGIGVEELGVGRQLASAPKLRRFLSAHKPTLLLTAIEQMHVSAVLACRMAGAGTRHIVTQHNPLSSQAKRPGLAFSSLPVLYRFVVSKADALVAVSAGVADDMAAEARIARERIEVIHNGAIGDDFEDLASRSRDVAFERGDGPVIITVGRLADQKNHDLLLRAFARLDQQPAPRLVIIGDGPAKARLQSLAAELRISDRVQMCGFCPNPLPSIKAADLFVLSSTYEGFGLVIVEALASGTPVVSTDCPFGPREILDHGRFGRLVPTDDVEALAEAMAAGLASGSRPDHTDRATAFTDRACAQKYLTVFRRLAS